VACFDFSEPRMNGGMGIPGGVGGRCHYEVLRLKPTATESEIRKAYKKLALIYHPDKNQFASATSRFQEIGKAYAVLGDKISRASYDRQRLPPRSPRTSSASTTHTTTFTSFHFGFASTSNNFGFTFSSTGAHSYFYSDEPKPAASGSSSSSSS